MSNELQFDYGIVNRTVTALLFDGQGFVWSTVSAVAAFRDQASITAAQIAPVSVAEKQTEDSVRRGFYIGDLPAGANAAASVEFRDAAVNSGGTSVGYQDLGTSAALTQISSRIASTPINLVSFIVAGGVLELNRGDDYLNSDGRAIPFNNPGNGPDLTGATVYLEVRRIADGEITFSVAGTIVGPTNAWTQVYFEPRAAQTSSLLQINQRAYEYKVLATWPALNPVKNETLVQVSPVVVKW